MERGEKKGGEEEREGVRWGEERGSGRRGERGGGIPTVAPRPGLMEVLTVPFRLMERLTAVIIGSSLRLGTMVIAYAPEALRSTISQTS